jgi:hypothetical protein
VCERERERERDGERERGGKREGERGGEKERGRGGGEGWGEGERVEGGERKRGEGESEREREKVEWKKPNIHYSQQTNNCREIKSPGKNEIRQASQKSEAVKNGMYHIIRLQWDR